MTMQNPVAMAANTLRQIGETGTQALTSLGSQFSQANSQLLRGLASGAPPFPLGLPIPGLGGNPGNPNGSNAGLLPTPASLLPTPALQALARLENSALPPGAPRPAAILLQAIGVGTGATPPANGERTVPSGAEERVVREVQPRATQRLERSGY